MRRTRWPGASVLILFLLMAAPMAWGQATNGTLPDPMTTGELERYGLRLGLSAAQQEAVQRLHDAYREEFRVLRDGEIAAFMGTMRGFEGTGAMPGRAQIESFFEEMERLSRRIETLDRSFFDRVSEILTEEQVARLPRVVQARQRRRHLAGQMLTGMIGGRVSDLSDMLLDLDLKPEERAAVEPALAPYETRLTAAVRDLHEANRTAILSTLDALEARGITEATWSDPEKMQELQEAMQEIFGGIMLKSFEHLRDLQQINRRAYAQIAPLLPVGRGAELRQRFLDTGYPMLAPAFRLSRAPFDEALARPGLSQAQMAAVEDLFQRVQRDLDRAALDGVTALDKAGVDMVAQMFAGEANAWEAQQKAVEEAVARAGAIRTAAGDELAAIVGERIAGVAPEAAVEASADWTGFAPGQVVVAEGAVAVMAQGTELEASGDQYLPGPLSSAHGDRIREALGLSEAQAAFVEGLLEEQRAAFAGFRAEHLDKVHEAQSALWRHTPDGGPPLSLEAADALMQRRRAARDAMIQMDEAFFDRLAQGLSLDAERIESLRLERRRETFQRPGMGVGWMMQTGEVGVDVPELARAIDLEASRERSLEGALRRHLAALVPAIETWSSAVMEWEHANLRLQAATSGFGEGQSFDVQEYQRLYREHAEPAQRRLHAAAGVVQRLNQEGLESVAALLPEAEGHRLRRSYRQQAFPEVYNDPTAVETHLGRARDLGDLSSEQRRRLDELAGEYVPAYSGLCDAMIERARLSPGMGRGMDGADWARVQEHQEALARLRFDRSELNGRAVAKLRSILSPQQVARVGPLPDVSVTQGQNWWE